MGRTKPLSLPFSGPGLSFCTPPSPLSTVIQKSLCMDGVGASIRMYLQPLANGAIDSIVLVAVGRANGPESALQPIFVFIV